MRHILIIIAAFLLADVGCSCNGGKGNDPIDMEEDVMEDVFEVDLLMPSQKTKETIMESVFSFIPNLYSYFGDTICITVRGSARWSTLENNNPYSIKIIDVDTCAFQLAIEGLNKESVMTWDRYFYQPMIQTVITILDTSTYSLHCDNDNDISPQTLFDRFRNFDSIAYTDIYFEMNLVKKLGSSAKCVSTN